MLAELTRLNSHLVWLATHAIDIGAMSVFLYCFREREEILRIFEMFSLLSNPTCAHVFPASTLL